jgi:hypothetical protein
MKAKRESKTVVLVVVGAAAGGGTVVFLALLWLVISSAPAEYFLLLLWGAGGLIGGAAFGLVLGKLAAKPGAVIGGVAGGIVGGVVVGLIVPVVMYLYLSIPRPSPKPLPSVDKRAFTSGASWGFDRVQTYTVTLPIDQVQEHYEGQMARYCQEGWQFEIRSDCWEFEEGIPCRFARCDIPRPVFDQYFTVTLYSLSETQTRVVHTDSWED